MSASLYNGTGNDYLGTINNVSPICGVDFCDSCGDCLACYDSDPCPTRDNHQWVVYEDELTQFIDRHSGALIVWVKP